jgi:aspartyl-tRNA(Asn)/glutamyl-tRNA(Gln) amidotransferase subunit C
MPISEADIEKIAQLAHLEITDDERRMFAPQIADIVTYVEQLNGIDTSGIEPALGGLTPEGERTESSRPDEVQPSLGQKTALEPAPDPASGHFRVPKVLGS